LVLIKSMILSMFQRFNCNVNMEIKTEEAYKEAFKKIDAFIADNFENSEAKQKNF